MAPDRRGFLLSGVGLVLAAVGCVPPPQPLAQTTPQAASPQLDGWDQEARGMLADALQSLRTFDGFQAFRVGAAPDSGVRLASELTWDPPSSGEWDAATHLSRTLHGRAEQLFVAITTAQVDAGVWREQRARAESAHGLLDLADALEAYRDRIDRLPPGDAVVALPLLDRAWGQFDSVASDWGGSRAESIGQV